MEHWAIVGGGILGLTLADRLIARGQRVTVIESAPSIGGLVSPWQVADVTWDRFYHVTLMSDSALRSMLQSVGLDGDIRWVTTKTGFYCDGQLYSMSNAVEFLRFPPLNLLEKFRLGTTIFYGSKLKNWQRLESIPVCEWLTRWSGRSTFEKIWRPLLRAKLGDTYEQASAAFIWSYISRMYKARRSGLKTEMFGYVPGGYARILQRVETSLRQRGVEFLLDTRVNKITSHQDTAIELAIQSKRSDGNDAAAVTQLAFDRCISTVPATSIAASCSQLSDREQQQLRQIPYIGVVCLSLLLKKPLSPFYVTNITDGSIPMTAVIDMSTVVPSEQTGGHHLVYLPRYWPSDHPGLEESDESITETFLTGLQRMYPELSRDDVFASRVARAKYVMAVPTLHYSQRLPAICTSVPRFYALNSAWITGGTLNVNETIELADHGLSTHIWPDTGRA